MQVLFVYVESSCCLQSFLLCSLINVCCLTHSVERMQLNPLHSLTHSLFRPYPHTQHITKAICKNLLSCFLFLRCCFVNSRIVLVIHHRLIPSPLSCHCTISFLFPFHSKLSSYDQPHFQVLNHRTVVYNQPTNNCN